MWIAFSGGLDSTCLVHAAAAVRGRLPGALAAVHLDHGLQPGSPGWVEHCRAVCDGLSVPLASRRLDLRRGPGDSLEAVARQARYAALATLLDPGDLLLTAHTQDDQAETLLLALIRGSGVHGLAAMPFSARLGAGLLVRPLLDVPRADLERYARLSGLSWLEDPSNAWLSIDRNYLRHRVLPLIRERWPAMAATLSRSAAHCAEAAGLVDRAAADALQGLGGRRPNTLSVPGLAALDPVLGRALLRLWLRRRGFEPPDSRHLARILGEVLPARADATPLVAWPGCEIRRYRGDLFALSPLPPPPAGLELSWSEAELELPSPLGRLRRLGNGNQGPGPAVPLRVRFGVEGLRCRPPGDGHRRTLKNLFQGAGVPPWIRPYCPLVFDDRDRLVAVGGVCGCSGPAGGQAAWRLLWFDHPWEGLGLVG